MTSFTQIYDQTHNFVDGNIEIANTLSNLGKAYLEVLVTGLSDSLANPILLGFLYQIDVNSKRSKPYPIVSQRQTINLDLSDCETFLFIPSNRLIDDYILRLYVSTQSGSSESIDLSAYALKSELPVLDNYVSESALATALSNYALVSQLPNLSGYVTSSNLSTALADYVLTVDLPSNSGSSQNFIALSANTTLESNKNYLATVSGLTFTLPSTPAIGDVIDIATGNFSLQVNHGDISHQVLNNNTYTVAGLDSGIMLKPYSAIRLRYCEANLWVSSFRSRVINNFTPQTIESTSSKKSYTASSANIAIAYGAALANMYNGVKIPTGSYGNDGFLSNNSSGEILLTFTEAVILDSLKLWNGQGNDGVGASADYWTTNMTIYAGNSAAGENLGSLTFANSTGTEQAKSFTPNISPSNQFFLAVSSPNMLGILELEFYGKAAFGGETLAA